MATRLHGNPRECPVPQRSRPCGRVVRAGQLMCAAHWRQVPKDVQRDVWRTFRAWERAMTDETWAAYLTARTAALDTFRSTR